MEEGDEVINPELEVFISYFENLNIDFEFDINEEYTSEIYGNIDVSPMNPQPETQPKPDHTVTQKRELSIDTRKLIVNN